MSALRVTMVQRDGVERVLETAKLEGTLMELARANNVAGILADCGGCCDCGTCHVYIDPEWEAVVGKPDDIEQNTLDLAGEDVRANSRLSCQIKLDAKLNGLRVVVARA